MLITRPLSRSFAKKMKTHCFLLSILGSTRQPRKLNRQTLVGHKAAFPQLREEQKTVFRIFFRSCGKLAARGLAAIWIVRLMSATKALSRSFNPPILRRSFLKVIWKLQNSESYLKVIWKLKEFWMLFSESYLKVIWRLTVSWKNSYSYPVCWVTVTVLTVSLIVASVRDWKLSSAHDCYCRLWCTVASITMVLTIDPADWLELGLEFVGFDKSRQRCHKTNRERFATHFGASPETHSLIFSRFWHAKWCLASCVGEAQERSLFSSCQSGC